MPRKFFTAAPSDTTSDTATDTASATSTDTPSDTSTADGDAPAAEQQEPQTGESRPPTPPGPASPRALPPTEGADAIIRKWAMWSAGFGLVPIPFVEFATTAGFSLKMLHSLSSYYGVEFRTEFGRSAITSLVGGAGIPLATMFVSSAVKAVPVMGTALSVVTGPVFAGGVTYAIGRVFAAHFGSGGTLFDFDPEKFRDYFHEQIEAGKAILAKQQGQSPEAAKAGEEPERASVH